MSPPIPTHPNVGRVDAEGSDRVKLKVSGQGMLLKELSCEIFCDVCSRHFAGNEHASG